MPQTLSNGPEGLIATRARNPQDASSTEASDANEASEANEASRGFGAAGKARPGKRKGSKKRSPALSKADWGPLGKHPDIEAIVARQRLHLPLSGRIEATAVTRAWKDAAAHHHPDRGGAHDTMQLVNGARDLLLGRGLT